MSVDLKIQRNYRRAGGQPGDRTTVLYGPQGSGKSETLVELLRQALECESVVDEWWPGAPLVKDALHVTNCTAAEVRTRHANVLLLSVEEARRLALQ